MVVCVVLVAVIFGVCRQQATSKAGGAGGSSVKRLRKPLGLSVRPSVRPWRGVSLSGVVQLRCDALRCDVLRGAARCCVALRCAVVSTVGQRHVFLCYYMCIPVIGGKGGGAFMHECPCVLFSMQSSRLCSIQPHQHIAHFTAYQRILHTCRPAPRRANFHVPDLHLHAADLPQGGEKVNALLTPPLVQWMKE